MTQKNDEKGNWLKRKSKIGHVKENIFVYWKEHGICKGMGKIHKAIYLNWRKRGKICNFLKI